MDANLFKSDDSITWCPGCGNFGILNIIRKALATLNRPPKDILLVSGIGQAAKLPHYVNVNCFNGLHGRALPAAAGAKMANRNLTVLVTTGDGDCYGEGGNHFIHNIRRNLDITVIVHDNQIYGLTKGQASPTTDTEYQTKIQFNGVILEPFHPLETAIALGCGFVARGYSGEIDYTADIIAQGIRHKGFALIDLLQPCVSFNKKNTREWYAQRIFKIEASYNPSDKAAAYEMASRWGDDIPIGVLYRKEKPTYEENSGLANLPPLIEQELGRISIENTLNEFL